MFNIFSIYWKILDWFFPPKCAGCNRWGFRFCPDCCLKTRQLPEFICIKCGDKLRKGSNQLCKRCDLNSPEFDAIRSWAFYDGVLKNAIIKLKFSGDLGLGEELANQLFEVTSEQNWRIDLVTCVPLDKWRLKERGFNQSANLARSLANKIGLPFSPLAIKRTKKTVSQIGLTMDDRILNVDSAFEADTNIVSGKSIIIVDDVVTTGSTLNSCASALKNANANKVYGITLARAERLQGE